MEAIIGLLDKLVAFFGANEGMLLSVGGFILLAIAKLVPNSNAGAIVSKIQWVFDLIARFAYALGNACKACGKFLGDLIKSDGILGKP